MSGGKTGRRGVLRDPAITADYARELLRYEPDTGRLIWRVNRHGKAKAGDEAGFILLGYRRMKLARQNVFAHRVIWLIVTGNWPTCKVDHRDCDGTNNRWSNLREASDLQNAHNRRVRRDSSTGHKGVSFYAKTSKYAAHIMVDYRNHHLGYFDTAEEAAAQYAAAAQRLHGEFRRVA